MVQRTWILLALALLILPACAPRPAPKAITPTPTSTAPPTPSAPHLTASPPSFPPAAALHIAEARWLGRGALLAARFMPDASALALGWANGVSLVDLPRLRERWYQPLPAPLLGLEVQPQGMRLAAVLENGQVLVLNLADGRPQTFTVTDPYAYWCGLDWAPDGRQLAVQCIGPERGDPIFILDSADGRVTQVPNSRVDADTRPNPRWSPDGQMVLLAALGEPCPRWLNRTSGTPRLTLQRGSACLSPYALTWTPTGMRLAVATGEGVLLLDGRSGEEVGTFAGQNAAGFTPLPVARTDLLYNPQGTRLVALGSLGLGSGAAADSSTPTQVWEVSTRRLLASLPTRGHEPLAAAFAGDALLLIYDDGSLTRWDYLQPTAREQPLGRVVGDAPAEQLLWSADGRRLAADSRFGGALVWDLAQPETPLLRFDAPLQAPVLSPNGSLALLAHPPSGQSLLYDLATRRALLSLPGSERGPLGAAFSPDGQRLAYGDAQRLRIVRLPQGREEAVLEGFPEGQRMTRVIWSPDGRALAAVSAPLATGNAEEPGLIRLWRYSPSGVWEALAESRSVRAAYPTPTLAAFSPDGRWAALEAMERPEAEATAVRVIDLEDGREHLRLEQHEVVGWLDARHLLTFEAQYDARLTLWEVPSGLHSSGRVTRIGGEVFAPGSVILARPATDGPNPGRALEVLDGGSGQRLARLSHGSDLIALAWSPDGRWLLSLAVDGSLRAWPISWGTAETPPAP